MPVSPSQWRSNFPITAHQLNQDLYTYDGSYFGANGVMFHSNRPLLVETFKGPQSVTIAKGGSFTQLGGKAGMAISVLDNAALYGTGSDGPGDEAHYGSSGAVAPGSAGGAGLLGGWQLMINFSGLHCEDGGTTVSTIGAAWFQQGNVLLDIGCMSPANPNWGSMGFAVDLIQRVPNLPGQTYAPGVFYQDSLSSGGFFVLESGATSTGFVSRFAEIWMGVCDGYGSQVASIPAPITAIGTATTLSSATLNTTIQQTFSLLNNPPMLNCQVQNNNAITANAVTVVPFTATPLNDNYSSYSTASTTYTVKLAGNYFAHANVIYATNWNAGAAIAGFQVNGTQYWGGAYNATPSGAQNTGASVTKILDLHAGDTVQVVTKTSTNSNFGVANVSHFIMAWMSPINTSTLTWNAPEVTGFQFMAGTSPGTAPTQLAGLMNTKIANDINFLLNRPYLTVHQTTAQSGISVSNTTSSNGQALTSMSTVGLVHGGLGDNYAGWSTANSWYVAPVNGWYFAVSEVNVATSSTANLVNSLVAGIFAPTSGGVTVPGGSGFFPAGDYYQAVTSAYSWTYPTGATAIGVYYLLAGETIQPVITYFSASTTATYGTDVSHGFLSHFNLFWMSN